MSGALELLVESGPLAIAPRYLGYMLSVLRGHADLVPRDPPVFQGRALSGTTVLDGIAVVPILGPIMQRTDAFGAFGAVSVGDIRATVGAALEDPAIKAVLLAIDSPGGEVAGVADLADELYAVRGRKPMAAAADEGMFSAAYWIGSAVGPVALPRTGGVGSIGALVVHADVSGALEKMGVRLEVIRSGKRKAQFSPFAPLTAEARDELQAEVDRVAGIFIAAVSRQRGLEASTIRGFEGGTFEGPAAVRAGLADSVSTLDQSFASLHAQVSGERRGRIQAMADEDKKAPAAPPEVTPEPKLDMAAIEADAKAHGRAHIYDLQKAHDEATQRARAKAIEEERARAAEITRWCAFAGKPEMAEEYIASELSLEGVRNELLSQTARASFEVETSRGIGARRPVLTIDEIYTRRRETIAIAKASRTATY